MAIVMLTEPTVEPITLQEAKDHLRVDSSTDDAGISETITTARRQVESITGRPLITQTHTLYDDSLFGYVCLKPSLQSVTSVKYLDGSGVQQTFTDYAIDSTPPTGVVYPSWGNSWPSPRGDRNSVEIEFIAGYGDVPQDVPAPIRSAILLLVGHLYENREPVVIGSSVAVVPMAVEYLLGPYQVVRF